MNYIRTVQQNVISFAMVNTIRIYFTRFCICACVVFTSMITAKNIMSVLARNILVIVC